MPHESHVPPCPAALIVAKPRRSRWCLEEAWDLAATLDSTVEETRYPGILLIPWRPGLTETMITPAIQRYKFAFASKVVIPSNCIPLREADPASIQARLEATLREASQVTGGLVRLIVALRGESRRYLSSSSLHDIMLKLNVRLNRKARHVIGVEGLDEYILVAWGRKASCGYQCILIGVEPEAHPPRNI